MHGVQANSNTTAVATMLWLQIFWKSIERRAISLPNDDKLKEYIGPTSRTDDPVPEEVGTAHPLLTRVFDI